ncbi:SIS domain-containing protein [Barnesiella sp. An55]|uniref:SIS domain-containing protein n=1 Tax=Barnesiella sp. An55 TaxID=1965646 RepID=UPI000B381EE8|nr:SIS domain-containing protein [Barnesiella sp. An55]OUN72516.1 hypothetical protein B5G10_07770 [Barnesiella sp. An55]
MSLCNSTTATYREIMQQPDVWLKAYDLVCRNESNIKKFISENQIDKDTEIILTGAGTSAFIGDALAGLFVEKGFAHCRAVATTDMITYPEKYLPVGRPIVLVSFARSGNSPESMAAVRIADKYCEKVFHIVITCNEEGDLARESSRENVLLLLLPAETNDKSLAMTSSFSTMALVSLLVLNIKQLPEQKVKVEAAADFAREIIAHSEKALAEIATRPFKRAVFLGSGPLKGIAEECHLKLQELTDGTIVCKFDSFLGFRHGPKAVINKDTLLVYLCSNEERVLRYERDLICQINGNNKVVAQVAVAPEGLELPGVQLDWVVKASNPEALRGNEYACIPYVLIGQLLGYYKSENLGLNPDEPSVSGNISRVVEGVKIYDL